MCTIRQRPGDIVYSYTLPISCLVGREVSPDSHPGMATLDMSSVQQAVFVFDSRPVHPRRVLFTEVTQQGPQVSHSLVSASHGYYRPLNLPRLCSFVRSVFPCAFQVSDPFFSFFIYLSEIACFARNFVGKSTCTISAGITYYPSLYVL